MILFAAIVPPLSALQAVDDFVRSADTGPLDLRAMDDVVLPIARFGNTTVGDADRLVAELESAAGEWGAPRLSLGGGSVTDSPSERTLGVGLRGDVDQLARLASQVKETAQHLRFLLDRRDFRPILALATVRAGVASGIDAAAAALDAFEGESWQVTHLSMRKQTYGDGGDSEEVAAIALPTD